MFVVRVRLDFIAAFSWVSSKPAVQQRGAFKPVARIGWFKV
jgi:hypothetical protein